MNHTKKLATFLFRRSWGEVFKGLPDEQAGKLIKAIYIYADGEDATPDDPQVKLFYKMITSQLNYSAGKYVKKVAIEADQEQTADTPPAQVEPVKQPGN